MTAALSESVRMAVHSALRSSRCAGTRELGCPACGAPMAVRPGRNGAFLGCTNYFDTECRGTREIIRVTDEPF